MTHSCPLCEEEAIPERCPHFLDSTEPWDQEDAEAPTTPDDYWANVVDLRLIREYLRRLSARAPGLRARALSPFE
jgi:hypothetical protein